MYNGICSQCNDFILWSDLYSEYFRIHFLTFSWQVGDDRSDGDIRGRDMDEDDSGRPKFTVSLRNCYNNITAHKRGNINNSA